MENNKKIPKLGDVDDTQLEVHLKLLKRWIVKFNKLNDCDDINLIVNLKSNFTRVKIYIDYFELITTTPQVAKEMNKNFPKYSKYITNSTKKILVSSKKITNEVAVFTDIIIVNYPFIHETVNKENFITIAKSNGLIGFSRAYVLKVFNPTCLLWSRTYRYACTCNGDQESYTKTANIFKRNAVDSELKDSLCLTCKKSHIRDKNSEIYIECQEIQFFVQTDRNVILNNVIKVWAYGDLINTVREGDVITLVAYSLPEANNTYEKEFEFGHMVALNFNIFIEAPCILSGAIQMRKSKIGDTSMYNFTSRFNEKNEIDILRSVKFQKQLSVKFSKFLLQNYQSNEAKGLAAPISFLNIVLDLSVVQKDYVITNKLYQLQGECKTDNLTNSRSLVFKSKIFESKPRSDLDVMKYFRIVKPVDCNKGESDYLASSLNLFLIFDDMKRDPSYMTILKYAEKYEDVITVYPSFTNFKNLQSFFMKCNHNIIIIPDIDILSKTEIETISNIMNGSSGLSVTFWLCCGSHKLKSSMGDISIKGFESILSSCEIILNLSRSNGKLRGCKWDDIDITSLSLRERNSLTLYEPAPLNCKDNHIYEDFNNSFSSAKLLEDYFIIKRDLTKINFNDINSMLRIATLFSILRSYYDERAPSFPCSISNLDYLDVILTIFLNEEYAGCKYGADCTSFGNVITQIIQADNRKECTNVVHHMKIKEKMDFCGNKGVIPRTRSSIRKVDVLNEISKQDRPCIECESLGRMNNDNEKIFTFLDKLTVFTYNN